MRMLMLMINAIFISTGFLALLFPFQLAHAARVQILTTKSYFVTVSDQCLHGDLMCKRVEYYSVEKSSGKTLRLKGTSDFRTCMDSKGPCEWYGFKFKKGTSVYYVTREQHLKIFENDQLILDEQGNELTWHESDQQ